MLRLSQLIRQSPFFGVLTILALPHAVVAQVGTVQAEQKISETAGGFGGALDGDDYFGVSIAAMGDLDGDGIDDIAIGAMGDDDGGSNLGAVWVVFLNADGTVKFEQKISATTGSFQGVLHPFDQFGCSVTSLGDFDGDGNGDIAVGANFDDDGDSAAGAVWILFLNADGTVSSQQKISATIGGFGGILHAFDMFGGSVTSLGDLDGDGIGDLAVGAIQDTDGGLSQGAVWILFLNSDGTVSSQQKVSTTSGGFGGALHPFDWFGQSLASLGDIDGDGIGDLAVGADGDDDGAILQGAVWILFLNSDGTVSSEQKISAVSGGFGGALDLGDHFGSSLAAMGDIDGDGIGDLAVGAPGDDDGGTSKGAVWILYLDTNGTVKAEQKISETVGGFGGIIPQGAFFGSSVAFLSDLDGDGGGDLAVGAIKDAKGAVWTLFLEGPDHNPPLLSCPPIISVTDAKGGPFGDFAFFTVTANDDIDPSPSVVCVPPSGSFFPRGTTIVTCTATDASGNQSMCAFPVVVMPTVRQQRL